MFINYRFNDYISMLFHEEQIKKKNYFTRVLKSLGTFFYANVPKNK